jgi:hypothetical protein
VTRSTGWEINQSRSISLSRNRVLCSNKLPRPAASSFLFIGYLGAFYVGIKRPEREVDPFSPFNLGDKYVEIYLRSPHAFMACALPFTRAFYCAKVKVKIKVTL